MLVAALRPTEPEAAQNLLDAIRFGDDAARLTVGALGVESVARIVRERIPAADDEVCQACHAATRGNALYLQELLRAVLADGTEIDREKVTQATVPSLGDRVLRRAARVSGEAPALARAMAVLGDGVRLATAASLAGIDKAPAGNIAHELRRLEVLAGEDPSTFVHPLVRRSVYDSMPEGERQAAHAVAARLLEQDGAPPETVAAHLRMLAASSSDAIAHALLVAAERALDRAAPDEAVGWLDRALEEGAADPPRVYLLSRLALARALKRDPGAVAPLREAYALAEEPGARARLAVTLAELLGHAGRWGDAIAVIEEIERDLGATELGVATEAAAARAVITLHDPIYIADFDRRRDTYVRLAGGQYWASRALDALLATEAAYRGRPQEALIFSARAREGGLLLAERGAGAWTPTFLIGALIEVDALEAVPAVTEQVEAAARSSGSTFALLSAFALRGWARARCGELAAAEADVAAALQLAEEADLLMAVTTALFFLIDALLERDSLARVAELAEQTELSPDFMRTASGGNLVEARGRLRVLRRDRERGIEDLRAAGRIFSALRFGPAHSSWRSALALALPRTERAHAHELAGEELELAEACGLARPIGIALRTLGVLEDGAAGIDLLTRSVRTLESSPARLEHARSLVELGACLRRANRRAEARAPLTSGFELAHVCGADRLAERARQELQAAGGRRPRARALGSEALTASELRVVKLAAAGATNTEIAQELFVSLKTVETHLTRAYGKLGLAGTGSRRRLARVLQGAGV